MRAFVYNGLPGRVVFGAGSVAKLPAELDLLGVRRALILSTPGRSASAKTVAASLGARVAGFFDRAQMHTPVAIAEDARRVAKELGADACVTVGGGRRSAWARRSRSLRDCPCSRCRRLTRVPR